MAEQMTDVYGVACDVLDVRTFKSGSQLGAGYDLSRPTEWFVYDRNESIGMIVWHKHCGPYSSFEQAVEWIQQIKESK